MWNRHMENVHELISVMAFALIAATGAFARAQAPSVAAAALPARERGMLDEFSAGYDRLVRCYDNIEMEVIYRTSKLDPKSDGSNIEEKIAHRYVYRVNAGKLFRMDSIKLNVQDESPTGAVVVQFFTPHRGHQWAEREKAGEPFVLGEGDPNFHIGKWLEHTFCIAPYTAYLFDTKPLVLGQSDLVAPSTAKLSITADEEGRDRLVTIILQGLSKRRGRDWRAKLVFYRDKSWALKEAHLGVVSLAEPDDANYFCRYEYEGMHDGVPLLKRAEYWREVGPERTRRRVESYQVVKIKPGPVNEEEFSLASLGLTVESQNGKCWQDQRSPAKGRRVRSRGRK